MLIAMNFYFADLLSLPGGAAFQPATTGSGNEGRRPLSRQRRFLDPIFSDYFGMANVMVDFNSTIWTFVVLLDTFTAVADTGSNLRALLPFTTTVDVSRSSCACSFFREKP